MNIYHIWCSLKDGIQDYEFAKHVQQYCDHLKENRHLHSYRITRRKLGLGPWHLPEFHIMLEFENMAQMDAAFSSVAARSDPIEGFHHAVNQQVKEVTFALYRDFPDPERIHGQERF